MTASPDTPDGLAQEIATVRTVYDAFDREDIEAALECMTPDVVLNLEATGRLAGRHEPYRGHDGVREYFADTRRVWDDLRFAPRSFHPGPDGVVARGDVRGRIGSQQIFAEITWTWSFRGGLVSGIRASGLGEVRPA